jgi:hypothetical protein
VVSVERLAPGQPVRGVIAASAALFIALNADNGYRIIPTPLAASSSRVNKGVIPNSVMLAKIGFETAAENFL